MDAERENQDSLLKRLRLAALSGGLAGAGFGGIGSILSGGSLPQAGIAALKGAAAGGIGAPTAIGAGHLLMGEPGNGEKNPNTRRGLVGGALLGGTLGLGTAALLSGKLPLARLGSLGEKAAAGLDADNVILKKMKELMTSKSKAKMAAGLGLGGGIGALAGGHFGSDEGMGLDVLQNELQAAHERKKKRQLLAEAGGI